MLNEKYKGKMFSVLGDSISTLEGYSVPFDAAYYAGEKRLYSDVITFEDTWWGKVISELEGELLVNNSISGSMVIRHADCEIPSYACSDERTSSLGSEDRLPDVIMIFMGTNDWGWGVQPMPDYESSSKNSSVFSVAYKLMLEKLKKNYPNAELWCFTLPIGTCSLKENFCYPYRTGGKHIDEYCDIIRECADEYNCRLIDLHRSGISHDTVDGFHPNKCGMMTLADCVITELNKL